MRLQDRLPALHLGKRVCSRAQDPSAKFAGIKNKLTFGVGLGFGVKKFSLPLRLSLPIASACFDVMCVCRMNVPRPSRRRTSCVSRCICSCLEAFFVQKSHLLAHSHDSTCVMVKTWAWPCSKDIDVATSSLPRRNREINNINEAARNATADTKQVTS